MEEIELILIYRAIKPFMTFDDMLTGDFIVYFNDGIIYIKYNTTSKDKNTFGKIICGNLKEYTYQNLIKEIWYNGKSSFNTKKIGQKNINGLWYENLEDFEHDIRMSIFKEGVSMNWKNKYNI